VTFVDMASLTWPEAERLGRDGRALGLIPLGAIEQHGPHLPLCTDCVIAVTLARHVAAALVEPVVVAPAVPGGLSSHHLEFPGTVDLPEQVLAGMITAYVEAFERMGLRDVAIFSAHGGNFAFLGRYREEHEARGSSTRLIAYDDLVPGYVQAMFAGARRGGLEPCPSDVHAGGVETSQMLAARPELVRSFAGVDGYTLAEDGFLDRVLEDGLRALTDTGVLGDVSGSSAAAGAEIFRMLAAELVRWIAASLGFTAGADVRLEQVSR
jgi:creatinine amidohydrolase